MKIILGSQSKGRQLVLRRAGIAFDVLAADIDEKAIRSDDYEKLPLLLARAKAKALLPKIQEPALLITSDQVVVCHDELREKPEDATQARYFLETIADWPHQTNTAVVVTNTITGKQVEGLDVTTVYFKPLSTRIVDAYLASGRPYTLAGGYGIQDPEIAPCIAKITGQADAVIGLPLALTRTLMMQAMED